MGQRSSKQHSTAGEKEILVVEDHEATAEMVRMLLEDEGYRVKRASTASEAIRLFEGLPQDNHDRCPDLILLDLNLPDMDSTEMVERLLETHHSAPPLIIVSAKPADVVEAAARSIGAIDVLPKPFDIEVLLQSIEHALPT